MSVYHRLWGRHLPLRNLPAMIHLSPELEDIQEVLVLQHAEGTVKVEAFQKTKWQVEKVEGVEGVAEPRPK